MRQSEEMTCDATSLVRSSGVLCCAVRLGFRLGARGARADRFADSSVIATQVVRAYGAYNMFCDGRMRDGAFSEHESDVTARATLRFLCTRAAKVHRGLLGFPGVYLFSRGRGPTRAAPLQAVCKARWPPAETAPNVAAACHENLPKQPYSARGVPPRHVLFFFSTKQQARRPCAWRLRTP